MGGTWFSVSGVQVPDTGFKGGSIYGLNRLSGGYLCSRVGLLVSGVKVACWVFDSGAYMGGGWFTVSLLCFAYVALGSGFLYGSSVS